MESKNYEVIICMVPFESVLERLKTIPAVKSCTERIIVKIGVDINRFPSDAYLSSCSAMSFENNESAVKRHSGRINFGCFENKKYLSQSPLPSLGCIFHGNRTMPGHWVTFCMGIRQMQTILCNSSFPYP